MFDLIPIFDWCYFSGVILWFHGEIVLVLGTGFVGVSGNIYIDMVAHRAIVVPI